MSLYIDGMDLPKDKPVTVKINPDGTVNSTASNGYQKYRAVPAADVRENVRGEFIGEYDGYADGEPVYDMWSCSVCGCYFEDWDDKPTYNFCPNCGAYMKGEKE